jgi:hypothetical protein
MRLGQHDPSVEPGETRPAAVEQRHRSSGKGTRMTMLPSSSTRA